MTNRQKIEALLNTIRGANLLAFQKGHRELVTLGVKAARRLTGMDDEEDTKVVRFKQAA